MKLKILLQFSSSECGHFLNGFGQLLVRIKRLTLKAQLICLLDFRTIFIFSNFRIGIEFEKTYILQENNT